MKNIQIRQVNKLAQQLLLPDEESKRAAICLAHLTKPGNSVVARESLTILLDALDQTKPQDTRKAAAWALASLVSHVKPEDLSNRIVPKLIQILEEYRLGDENMSVIRQAYQSLNHIGTPDAIMATETWRARVKDSRNQTR